MVRAPVGWGGFDAVGAVAAPGVAVEIVGDEVPAAARCDDTGGLGVAAGFGAGGVTVGEAQAFSVGDSGGEGGEDLGVDGRALARADRDRRTDHAHPSAQFRRQDLLELGQGPHRGVLDARDRLSRSDSQPDSHRDRLVRVEDQRRQRRTRGEPVPTGGTHRRDHRVPQLAQPVDVASHGPVGDAEPIGQFAARPLPWHLQQGEQTEQAGGGVGHVLDSAGYLGPNLS